jgi:type I site-specific restriction endonuclease
VQDRKNANPSAGHGVAIREFHIKPGYGEADYLLYVDGMAIGVIETKKEGSTLTGFELQTEKYSDASRSHSAIRALGLRLASAIFWNRRRPAATSLPFIARKRWVRGSSRNRSSRAQP